MKAFLLILALAAPGAAPALESPKQSPNDPHIQHVDYNPDDVVEINARPGYATQVVFADGEEILDIASGFTQGWEFGNRRNHLYLKPKTVKLADNTAMEPRAGKWDTNLIVTTNRRPYAFRLVLHHFDKPRIAYRIAFRYPADEEARAKAAAERQAAAEKAERTSEPANWNYTMQLGEDSEEIAPAMACDDGRFTYLRFPGNREFPAVFAVAGDKSESLVNTHIDPKAPDVLVIHRVAREFILRLGRAVVGVYNEAFDPFGRPAATGSAVPGLMRALKAGETATDAPGETPAPPPASPPPVSGGEEDTVDSVYKAEKSQ
ncbi:MAG: P-type conjugative transfer protein VirB9 [Candidatus Accumulibacter sp.]|jgi:P-type conjugative transfer protein VirB9|nr:P-type conjugative transfer protein VirB9 [Accumulibacter sp.]